MHAGHPVARAMAVLSVIAALAACGSGESSGGTSTSTTGRSSSSGSGSTDFGALAERGAKATVRITYRNADGTTFTLAQDPPKQALISEDGRWITDGDRTVICTGQGSSAECLEMPKSGSDQIGSLLGVFAAPFELIKDLDRNALTTKGVKTSSDTIAGRKAACAEVDASKIAGSGSSGTEEVCVDKETGVLLRATSDGKVQLEATDIGKPKSDDFDPPSTPQTVPSSGG